MRLTPALLLALLLAAPAAAQADPDTTVFEVIDQMPELIGGLASIRPVYPDEERQAGIEGRVILQFVVDETGAVSDVTVTRGVSPGLDAAAAAAVQEARFRPGMHHGRPVKVRFALPINFRLQADPPVYAAADFLLRDRPGAGTVARVSAGAPLTVQACTAGWCRVSLGGITGYVEQALLTTTPPAPPPPAPRR